jgi:serine/threonine protein kinase
MALPGESLQFDNRFTILSSVGRGRDTFVYHARINDSSNEEVALKVLSNKIKRSTAVARLHNEATALLLASHPSVIKLLGFHSFHEYHYLTLEYAPFGDITRFANSKNGKISSDQAFKFYLQALQGLDYIHSVGIVHRDIKPDNLLVMNENELRIADFGVTYRPSQPNMAENLDLTVGTMSYLSPEILEGGVSDSQGDIYAMALTFYQVMAGFNPFDNVPLVQQMELRKTLNIPHIKELVPDIKNDFADVIMQCLAYSRYERFSSAAEIISKLTQGIIFTSPKTNLSLKGVDSSGRGSVTRLDRTERVSTSASTEEVIKSQNSINPKLKINNEDTLNLNKLGLDRNIENKYATNLISEKKMANQGSNRKKHKEKRSKSYRRRSNRLLLLVLISLIGATGVLAFSFFQGRLSLGKGVISSLTGSNITSPTNIAKDKNTEDKVNPVATIIINNSVNKKSSFPYLAQGTYVGNIKSLFSNKPTPLSIFSLPNKGSVAIILGLEGWTPRVVTPSKDSTILKVASNGIVLEFTATKNTDNTIFGNVENVVTGESGTWEISLSS